MRRLNIGGNSGGVELSQRLPIGPEALENAKIIREMLKHEDDVLDQRFTWLYQIQGFLFAALAFAWKDPTAYYLVILLSLVGIMVAITSSLALGATSNGIGNLLNWWHSYKPEDYFGPDVQARSISSSLDAPYSIWARARWARPWHLVPLLFCLAWIGVIIIRIRL